MDLTPDETASFAKIIDTILLSSDINTVSEKRIRRQLQEEVGQDLTPRKEAVNKLIIQRFDLFVETHGNGETVNGTTAAPSNGAQHQPAPSHSGSSASPQKRSAELDSSAPPKKKRKDSGGVDADAAYAAKLQAEENLRARPTRGGNTRKTPATTKKKKAKSKGPKKISLEDDSDATGSGSEPKKEVNRSGGFHKPLNLSAPLSALIGEATLSRPQTVKKLWEYIHEHQLQDPADKRHILCDEPMRAVFKQDRVHMFTMTKLLSQNLYSPDE